MEATNIQEAKILIQSSLVKTRTKGLQNLIHILRHNRGKPSLEALGNKAYLALCETLFQCLRDERSATAKSTAKNPKSTTNLVLCATALRCVIASGVRTIKSSTVEVIIDTIIEVLPSRDNSRLKPLLEDIPKTLRLLLEYHPHVERLSLDSWNGTVDFCIDALAGSSIETEIEASNSWSTNMSSRGRTPLGAPDASIARGSPRETVARTKSLTDEFSPSSEDYIHCLLALVRATNAPVLDKAEAIMTALLYFLKRRNGRGSVATAALAGINAIIARTALQKLDLSKRMIKELLPLMKVMWSEQILRDEILITLAYTEAHLSSLVTDLEDATTCADLEAVLETMYADYRTRKETTMQQYLEEDCLCYRHLGATDPDTHPLNTLVFSLETDHLKSEGLWATVHSIARFSSMLDKRKRLIAHNREADGESVSKRARIDLSFDEYSRHLAEPRSNAKRAALQVIAFSVQEGPVGKDTFQVLTDRLTSCMSDENTTHAVWAMVALTAAAYQKVAQHHDFLPSWISIWQSASRAITSPSLARAACHLMDVLLKLEIVPFNAVSDTVQSMLLSIEVTGPSLLTESSASFMSTIMRERMKENPSHSVQTAERIMSWILIKWTPSLWSERTYAATNAHHYNAQDVLQILFAALDMPQSPTDSSPFLVLGCISRARAWNTRYRTLAQYLLLLDIDVEYLTSTPTRLSPSPLPAPKHQTSNVEIRILEHCLSEVEKTRERWNEAQSSIQNITSDMMRLVTNLCIIASAVANLSNPQDRRVNALDSSIEKLARAFVSTLSKPQTEQYKIDAVLKTCTRSLPALDSYNTLNPNVFRQRGISLLSRHISKALGARVEVKQSFYAEEDDFMDLDDGNDSQMTSNLAHLESDVPRHTEQAETDIAALRASASSYLNLVAALTDSTNQNADQVPASFVEYLISLNENELLRSRQFVRSLLHSGLRLARTDCLNLLERLGDALAAPRAREYNTSEVANGMLVEFLIGTTLVWVPDEKDSEAKVLYENVEDMYAYFVKGLEKNGVRRSIHLQEIIAIFLHGLLKHHPNFGLDPKIPSVRTSLFELLSESEIVVKYHIAERLPSMFEDFVLAEHDKILQDVDSSLPGEAEGLEGISLRLLVLSRLASQWHTLLRSSIYRIFATAGSVKQAARHAERCISKVAAARGIKTPQDLFKLFAPQLLFTWLDRGNKFESIPYLIFGYVSLAKLIEAVEAEAVGQAMMFGRKDEAEYLAKQLATNLSDLLCKNIGKAGAYTISWDICRGFARNKAEPSYANLLKELMGSDKYFSLVQKHFPQVLACILQTIDQEQRIEKSLEKKPAFTPAAKTLADMLNISHSSQDLNTGIEPVFNAFYLPDQLERLCRRTGDDPVGFWNPSTFTYVMRALLDRIHPALGSLYARSMIRKIRIVIALAGPVAYQGYPLQMTLQSLRPFLTDVQCAEDTVGIMQYLFEHGSQYLRQHLNFVTGIGVSILISIRVFLGTAQDSTTQQSQHIATMSTANRFHTWLTDYLKSHAEAISLNERSSSVRAFKSITAAASQVRAEGNSMRGSEESTLLVEILNDVRSGRRLLNKTSREVALNLLCQDFQLATTAREDILGRDQDAAEYAGLVWESCRRSNVGEGYLLWAAKVLGRAFSAQGEVRQAVLGSKRRIPASQSSKDPSGKTSKETIIKEVVDLFYSDERHEVSLAENAVRYLIARLHKSERQYETEVYSAIPDAIGKALMLYIPDPFIASFNTSSQCLELAAAPTKSKSVGVWVRDFAVALCAVASEDPILGALPALLHGIEHLAERLFPYILHLVLLDEYEKERNTREAVSSAAAAWFNSVNSEAVPYVRIIIQAVLYLRSQPVPKESTRADRDKWLEIEYLDASQAAATCAMYRSALLFAETSFGQPVPKTTSRRSSKVLVPPPTLPTELQLAIYKNLDEPDSFYGIDRGSDLSAVLDRLDYEEDGVKSLIFRGARLDSQLRRQNELESSDTRGTVRSLIMLNMNSVTNSLLSTDQFRDKGDEAVESALHTARKLAQWDVKAPETNHTESATLFKAFQGLHTAKTPEQAKANFSKQMLATMKFLTGRDRSSVPIKSRLRTLAVLTEADEVLRADNPDYLLDVWDCMKAREKWMQAGEFTDVRQLLSCRETLFNVLSTNNAMIDSLHTRTATICNMEVQALVSSSSISRRHGAIQESLASVTYLSDIVPKCKNVGLDIEATAQHEVANVLWEQGETDTSIRIRQNLIEHASFDSQSVELSLPVLLARLGHHLAEARLAKPDAIMQEYLEPAIRELKGQEQGPGPGQVFHEFALFCDKQLQSPEAAEDLDRIKTVMDRKLQEYNDFIKLAKTEKSKSMRETYQRSARRAKTWYDLDNTEYERMRKGREQFLRQCLENYLLSLAASDDYNNDALRVFALWIEYADTELANEAVKLYLKKVPSGKFALLMNQLSSRLQSESTPFQKLLLGLVYRICVEHPYHGMHQIFAIQMKVGPITREDVARSKDESARSRQKAAQQLAQHLNADKRAGPYWSSIYQSNEIYHNLAMFKSEKESTQQGRELPLDRYKESKELVSAIPKLHIPPATLQIEVRPNMDYNDLPRIQRFKPTMNIANGLSAPKIITAIGTDGKPYKQLFKSGNDDLRQDAIMEQVFDQVSRLLKNHTSTRIRNIGIRTYKVLPLSTRSGLMEFVPNTLPLHTWVMPAHERYYPNDYKSDRCRKEIGACQSDSLSTRVKVWKKVTDNFHPVMRYFLLERFEDPDEWFERRLAYTRSTAAISILGHVLGLGDRHCHNILLDEKSGEVVHIDLGVSFEAGRVLPIPEVVPFRLTRDLVDGMGYTKTEGVFRRCCEFTMDTLREERESIMTLLNVLRYDPLVNWSVTPTKAKRMQEGDATNTARGQSVAPGGTPAPPGSALEQAEVMQETLKKKEREEQAGEAGRALSVVEKKLSKTLSTKATVNELIQQATDEKNLAVLYMGWASYA